MGILKHLKDVAQGKTELGNMRSGKWPAVRKRHLVEHPRCAVCGGESGLEVHHIHPFHLHPNMELDPTNLITLCESKHNGVNCHLLFGHLGNFKSVNIGVEVDATIWSHKIGGRP